MIEENGTAMPNNQLRSPVASRKTYSIIALVSLCLLVGLTAAVLYHLDAQTKATLLSQHAPALIGTPFAILVTTLLVSGARAIDGELSGSLFDAELRGATAILFSWLPMFLAFVFALRLLW